MVINNLQGKLGIAVSATYAGRGENPVLAFINRFMISNRMIVLDSVSAKRYKTSNK